MTKDNNQKERLNKAWIVMWNFYSKDKDGALLRLGIKNKIIDIVSCRKNFETILEITKNIYFQRVLSFSEKIYCAHYIQEKKRKQEMLPRITTHYRSDIYRKLIESVDKNGHNNIQTKSLSEQWKGYPEYIIIGYNPSIEAHKVYDLHIVGGESGNEILHWKQKMKNGRLKQYKYQIN